MCSLIKQTALNHDLLLHWFIQNDLDNVRATEIIYSVHMPNQKSPNLLFYIANGNLNTVHAFICFANYLSRLAIFLKNRHSPVVFAWWNLWLTNFSITSFEMSSLHLRLLLLLQILAHLPHNQRMYTGMK